MNEFGPPGGARVPGAPPWIRQCYAVLIVPCTLRNTSNICSPCTVESLCAVSLLLGHSLSNIIVISETIFHFTFFNDQHERPTVVDMGQTLRTQLILSSIFEKEKKKENEKIPVSPGDQKLRKPVKTTVKSLTPTECYLQKGNSIFSGEPSNSQCHVLRHWGSSVHVAFYDDPPLTGPRVLYRFMCKFCCTSLKVMSLLTTFPSIIEYLWSWVVN